MKKSLLAIIFSLVFLFSVVGCTPQIVINNGDQSKPESTASISETQTQEAENTTVNETVSDSAPTESQATASTQSTAQSGAQSGGTVSKSTNTSSAAQTQITKEKAKAIAFGDAGVKEAEVYDLEIELDRDDGVLSWEIEFDSASKEYKYDIDAKTGKILKAEKDGKKTADTTSKTVSSSSNITKTKAKSIAFNHAGVKEADVRDLEIEFDEDNGVASYEIKFESNGVEYEYDIKASDGKILKSEKDIED